MRKQEKKRKRKIPKIVAYGAFNETVCTAPLGPITDLHMLYQQPECLPPLQVDSDKPGKDSDHNIVILARIMIDNNRKRNKKAVVTRPLTSTGHSAVIRLYLLT